METVQKHLSNLREIRTESGLFLASMRGVATGYDKIWLRDNVYEALAFEYAGEWGVVQQTYHSLLDIFLKHKDKIHWAVNNKPYETWQFIHARYNPETLGEFYESWGNKQHDAVGAILFKLADFEAKGKSMIRDEADRDIIQTLIHYICNVEYWHDPDSGMWEEKSEVHASSVGAVLAGLKKWRDIGGMDVPARAIEEGGKALAALLPRESSAKFTDLAQLSLIYPYAIVDDTTAREIVRNVSYHLEKKHGVIRYKFDGYFNANKDGYSEEAEWCFGFSWLAIIHARLGASGRARGYLAKATAVITADGKIPELYYSHTVKPNENVPLGWAESLYVVALYEVEKLNPKK
ncbi:glycoside hydrolase family 15 protein [bacterium]|nr:glycoside hydrolase family 15 protein [bacterium]